MIDVVAVVEGPTEQTFVSRVLAGHLVLRGVSIRAILSGRRGKKGGVPRWSAALDDLRRVLKQGRVCTTMFDYYGMRPDWPGRLAAAELPMEQRGEHVEEALSEAIQVAMGADFQGRRFVPYVQMHEFEALAFADPDVLGGYLSPLGRISTERLVRELRAIVRECGAPERIDDGHETCPSRRIGALVSGYRKPLVGPIVTEAIGIDRLREACPHFDRWLTRLEDLAE